jgi:hypothetical protein
MMLTNQTHGATNQRQLYRAPSRQRVMNVQLSRPLQAATDPAHAHGRLIRLPRQDRRPRQRENSPGKIYKHSSTLSTSCFPNGAGAAAARGGGAGQASCVNQESWEFTSRELSNNNWYKGVHKESLSPAPIAGTTHLCDNSIDITSWEGPSYFTPA